jgi:hypothetical protein
LNHLTGVVAGPVPATPNIEAQSKIIEMAGTSPATTGAKFFRLNGTLAVAYGSSSLSQ